MASQSGSSQDLWQKALDLLSPQLQASLEQVKTNKRDVLAAVLKVAEEKRQICLLKRWKFKNSKGEEVIVRDVLEKIARWINKFKEVGDTVVQYDPVHAALPWAGVRFLLQTAVNDIELFGSMVSDLEVLACLLARYRVFENLHLNQPSVVKAELTEAVTRLYAQVLVFLAKKVQYFQESTRGKYNACSSIGDYKSLTFIARLGKSAFRTVNDQLLEKISAQETEILKLAGLVDTERLLNLETAMIRLADQTLVSDSELQESQYLEVLRWTSSAPFSRHHDYHSQKRVPGTGTWFLSHTEYKKWIWSSSSSILLLSGIPGSGKTKLCSAVVDKFLTETSPGGSKTPLAYFYCADSQSEPERSSPDGILRSIVRQLAITAAPNPTICDILLNDFNRRQALARKDGFELDRLRTHDCVRLILEIIGTNPANIVIDAIDEVNESCIQELLEALNQIVADSTNVVKVFLTSRDDSYISGLLSRAVKIRINNGDNRDDIVAFTQLRLEEMKLEERLQNEDDLLSLKKDLASMLLERAGEMFLLVDLQVGRFRGMRCKQDILNAIRESSLTKLDTKLDRLFTGIFARILDAEPVARNIAIRTFSWLLFGKESLSPSAFISAVSSPNITSAPTHLGLSELMNICHNLIVLDSKSNTIRFSHQTVQEFARKQTIFVGSDSHGILATSCLHTCMQGPPDNDEPDFSITESFYNYGSTYWGDHYKVTESTAPNALNNELYDLMIQFVFEDILSFISWLDRVHHLAAALPRGHHKKRALSALSSSNSSPLFAACVFGLKTLLDHIITTEQISWEQRNDLGHTGIYLASAFGHSDIVCILIEKGADVNVSCGKHGNPINAACFGGHTNVVQVLMGHGAKTRSGNASQNALQIAFARNQEDVAILLLRSGTEILDQDSYDSALLGASQAGSLKAVELLLNSEYSHMRSVDTSHIGRLKAGVATTIKNGHIKALECFLKRTSNVHELLPNDGVSMAALYGKQDMMMLLLNKGLSMEQPGILGSPLRVASLMGHESIVNHLLSRGTNINACDITGTALQAAAMRGHERISRLLIQEGADVNLHGGYYGTALQAAAFHGHTAVVQILLDAKARVYDQGLSKDAFHAAAEGGHQEIILLLIQQGFPLRDIPLLGVKIEVCGVSSTCLKYSMDLEYRKKPASLYNALIRDASPDRDQHPRSWQPRSRHRGDSVSETRHYTSISNFDQIFVAMSMPKISSSENSIRCYYEKPVSLGRNSERNYALEAAASLGHTSVVRLLIEQRDTLGIHGHEIDCALEEAALHNHFDVIKILVEAKPNLEFYTSNALAIAASRGNVDVANALLTYISANGYIEGCTKSMLSLGCRGNIPILMQALDLISHQNSHDDLEKMWQVALVDAAKYNCPQAINIILESNGQLGKDAMSKAFNDACAAGSTTAVATILRNFPGLLESEDLKTHMTTAALKGYYELVLFFVKPSDDRYKAAVTAESLIFAAGNGYANIVRLLVDNFNGEQTFGTTIARALSISSRNGHEEVVDLLCSVGADVNVVLDQALLPQPKTDYPLPFRDEMSQPCKTTALHQCLQGLARFTKLGNDRSDFRGLPVVGYRWNLATQEAQEASIQHLLKHGADVNALDGQKNYLIYIAAKYCSEKIVKSFIDAGADVNAAVGKKSALDAAVGRERSAGAIVQHLIHAGAECFSDQPGMNPLLRTALKYFIGETRGSFYVSEGLDGRFPEAGSLEYVLYEGPGAVIQILLSNLSGETTDDEGFGLLLQMAAVVDHRPCIDLLLERKTNVNSTGYYYGTALQAACRFGHQNLVHRLLLAHADVNIVQGRYQTALRAAVVRGHLGIVETLISYGADVGLRFDNEQLDTCDRENVSLSALHLAVERGYVEITQRLLAAGADMHQDLPDSPHMLIKASKAGNTAMVELLLVAGVSVNVRGGKHLYKDSTEAEAASPLHAACAQGHSDIVNVLLNHGADVDAEFDTSGTPLIIASQNGHMRIVQLLLIAGAKTDHNSGSIALCEACSRGHFDVVKELIFHGATIWKFGTNRNALVSACSSENLSIIELLLERLTGTEMEIPVLAEAMNTVSKGYNRKVFELLLEYKSSNTEILIQSCNIGSLSAVQMALDAGVPVDSQDNMGVRPLHVAAFRMQAEIVRLLISVGANVNHKIDKYGNPIVATLQGCAAQKLRRKQDLRAKSLLAELLQPLTHQAHDDIHFNITTPEPKYKYLVDCEDIVQYLIRHGGNVDSDCGSFGNALHLASFLGNEKLLHIILDNGVDINRHGGYFESALFAAIDSNNPGIVEILVTRGIDLQHISSEHGTALQYACSLRNKAIVKLLLEHGADPNSTARTGCSSLMTAMQISPVEIIGYQNSTVELILQYGKNVRVSEADLMAAAKHPLNPELLQLFLEHDKMVTVSEDIVVIFLQGYKYWEVECLAILLERNGGIGTTEKMLKNVRDDETLRLLLSQRPVAKITTEILEAMGNKRLIQTLLEYDPMVMPNDTVVITALESYVNPDIQVRSCDDILERLWERNPDLEVTETMLKVAKTAKDLLFLLAHSSPTLHISENFLDGVMYPYYPNSEFLRVMFRRQPAIRVSTGTCAKLLSGSNKNEILSTLLEHDPNVPITEDIFIVLFQFNSTDEDRVESVALLKKYGKRVRFTERMRQWIDMTYKDAHASKMKEIYNSLAEEEGEVQ